MANNETKIVISARDEASAVLQNISRQFSAMHAPLNSLQGAVAGLGAAFAGLSIIGSVKGALAMADELGKMAQKTGVAVEEFSKLSYAAKLSDVSNEQLATGLKKLSKNMTEAAAGSGEAQKYFAALGVSVTDGAGKLKTADAVMVELASAFSGMEDGATKTAAAMGIFGKSGADLIPLLNEGSDGIKTMADEATRLGLVMSDDMARGAEQFNDNLTRLKAAGDGLSITLANQMLPGLTSVTNAMVEAAKQGGLLEAAWVGLGGLGAALFTDEFDGPQKKIKALKQDIMDMQRHLPDVGPGSGLLQKWMYGSEAELNAGIENARKQITALEAEMNAAAKSGDDAAKARSAESKKRAEETEARLRKLLSESGSNKPAAHVKESDYSKINKQLGEQIALADAALLATTKLTEGEKLQAKILEEISSGRAKMTAAQKLSIESDLKELLAKQNQNAANEEARRLAKAAIEDREKLVLESYKNIRAIEDEAIRQEDANAVYGEGKSAIEDLTIAKLELRLASLDYADASVEEVDALEKEIKARKRLATAMKDGEVKDASAKAAKDAATEWQKTTDQINQSLTDALMRGFESGKDFASSLKDSIVNMFKTMILRPVISAIMSPISLGVSGILGGLGIPGMANAAGGVGSALSMAQTGGSIYNLATSGVIGNTVSALGTGATTIGGVLGATGAEVLTASSLGTAVGSAQTTMLAAQTAGMGASTGVMGGISSALSAIPVWGWAAMGALALFSFMKKGGGPKVEGNAFGQISESNSLDIVRSSDKFAAPFGDGNWNRPGEQAGAVEEVLKPFGKGLTDYISKLGGSAAGLGFHVGYNSDPKGDAPDNVASTLLGKDGKELYKRVYDVEKGKGAEAMAAEFNAMTLAAAQAVDLTPILDALLDGLGDVGKMSEEAIQQSLASLEGISKITAGAFEKTFGEVFDVEKIKALGSSGENLLQTFGRLATEFEATNYIVEMMGQNVSTAFGAIGMASAEARESLISMAGGLEALGAKTGFFFEKYYTEEERKAQAMKGYESALKDGFSTLGISIPTTTQQFRDLVEAQDLSTDAGRETYLQILDLADEFYALAEAGGSAAMGIQSIIAAANAVGTGNYGSYNVAQANSGEASYSVTDGFMGIPDVHTATGVDLTRFQTTIPEGYSPSGVTNALNTLGMTPPTTIAGIISQNSAIQYLAGAGVTTQLGDILKTAKRAYAGGGYVSPGMALVGEKGPEIVDFGAPARVYTAEETRRAMSGSGSDDRTAAEIKSLRDEIKAALFAVAKNTRETAKLMAIWNGDGMPEVRPA